MKHVNIDSKYISWTSTPTRVDIGDWDKEDWYYAEDEMIEWLLLYDSDGFFSFHRRLHTIWFDKAQDAAMFILRWS